MNVAELLAEARARLGAAPSGPLEAEVLLRFVLGKGRAWLFANPDAEVPAGDAGRFRGLVDRRAGGEPVAYLVSEREFWSLRLKVSTEVLIPRPETELLVEVALQAIPPSGAWRVADIGTGSGAIAIAIARERPACEVHATDISEAALTLARENVRNLAPGRVHLHLGSWLEPLEGLFHLIVSNPPYVAENDPHLQQGDCRFEPRQALTAGPDGLAAIRCIAEQAQHALGDGGILAFEHGYDQGEEVRSLLESLNYTAIETRRDLEGRDRVTVCKWR
ncbi:MAG: peptide chain release factor N(5)-glutamine methyltransferase [Lysobacterales bacterium]